jgi:hypothetical protein
MGPTGDVGQPGRDGREGGTPYLLTPLTSRALQYAHEDGVLEVLQQNIVPEENGVLVVRAYFSGTVTKRVDAPSCLVQVGVRRNDEAIALFSQNVGILDGPVAQRMEVSIGGTLAGRVDVTGGRPELFRVEIRKADAACAPQGVQGPTQIAQIFVQLEVQYFRTQLPTQ